jgi:FtsZ-binding cell division protein ZapB
MSCGAESFNSEGTELHCHGCYKELADQITALQAELEHYRGIAMTEGAEKALADYKALQEENERLKTTIRQYLERPSLDGRRSVKPPMQTYYEDQIAALQAENEELKKYTDTVWTVREIDQLRTRCDELEKENAMLSEQNAILRQPTKIQAEARAAGFEEGRKQAYEDAVVYIKELCASGEFERAQLRMATLIKNAIKAKLGGAE